MLLCSIKNSDQWRHVLARSTGSSVDDGFLLSVATAIVGDIDE